MNFSDVFKRPLSKAELNLLGKRELVELLTIFQTRENLLLQVILNVAGLAGHLAEFSIAAKHPPVPDAGSDFWRLPQV